MQKEPLSKLTAERPHIWLRGLALATGLTGFDYTHKANPLSACGRITWREPKTPKPEDNKEEGYTWIEGDGEWVKHYPRDEIKNPEPVIKDRRVHWNSETGHWEYWDRDTSKMVIIKNKKITPSKKKAAMPVPEGAMEWLLHETGHWVVSTPEERLMSNYGYDELDLDGWGKAREIQAWAFEEIIMAPFGSSRMFAPASQRDGAAFSKIGLIPDFHLRHAERQIKACGLDIEEWRSVYGEWVKWGKQSNIYTPLH